MVAKFFPVGLIAVLGVLFNSLPETEYVQAFFGADVEGVSEVAFQGTWGYKEQVRQLFQLVAALLEGGTVEGLQYIFEVPVGGEGGMLPEKGFQQLLMAGRPLASYTAFSSREI